MNAVERWEQATGKEISPDGSISESDDSTDSSSSGLPSSRGSEQTQDLIDRQTDDSRDDDYTVPDDDPAAGSGTNGSDHTIISGRNEGSSDTTVGPSEGVEDTDGDGSADTVVTTPDSRTDGTPNSSQEDRGTTAPDDSTDTSDSSGSGGPSSDSSPTGPTGPAGLPMEAVGAVAGIMLLVALWGWWQ
ncbi:hypothetical protein GOC74_05380 [Halomicrobium mukohataei]|uniref:Uncharacterized protein n=1 Tax=Halomicrobium mukohataei TaxID=57705 RepID=A0A847UD01_9EURY|nr:hypothetical protein [Halomicrobium mukohataei]NLV09360.1 hypothetical protein [Halomicrobium mukohataei]